MPKSNELINLMSYTTDKSGKEVLKCGDIPIMMEWERPYMQACIDALKPKGNVLEIGFGLGYSATAIQTYHPKSHTIIEFDSAVVQRAKQWAQKYSGIKIIEGMWQDVLGSLGFYDSIFFDDYMPLNANSIMQISKNAEFCKKMTEETSLLKEAIAQSLKRFEGVTFSDEDLKVFMQEVQSNPSANFQDVIDFMETLVNLGNITISQKDEFLKNLKKQGIEKNSRQQEILKSEQSIATNSKLALGEWLITFIETCLNNHMKPGATLSAYWGTPESKMQNPEFQKKILSRKDIKFTEKVIPINAPSDCPYYQGNQALILVFEKL